MTAAGPLWIFGYGSLMWRPGFAFRSQSVARLRGCHRALCIRSTHYRGTLTRPGLVFGLDWGGVCDGIAFEIAPEDAERVLHAVRARELIYGVYREARVPITLLSSEPKTDGHRVVDAVTFIAERAHPSYTGTLPLAVQAGIIRGARGVAGSNLAYLVNTLQHLRELTLRDRAIERVGTMIAAHALSNGAGGEVHSARVEALSGNWKPKRSRAGKRHRVQRRLEQSRFGHRKALGLWR